MKWTDELKDMVAAMLRDGLSSSEIGAAVGVSKESIISAVRRFDELRAIGFIRPPGGQKGPNAKERRKQIIREGSVGKMAAGIGYMVRVPASVIEQRRAEMMRVIDGRDTTAVLMGDPPRRDPRRTWAPHLAGDQ